MRPANLLKPDDHVHELFCVGLSRLMLLLRFQWYSSESEPPGTRMVRTPAACSSVTVWALPASGSHMTALRPKTRSSTVRTVLAASTLTVTLWAKVSAGQASASRE